jgi:hypothetical protein
MADPLLQDAVRRKPNVKAEEEATCELTKTACDFTNRLVDECKQTGEHREPAATLQAAVAAYRTMLQSLTRESTPLDWAITQDNLGIVLEQLGEQQDSPMNFEEAVAAYRDALLVLTHERVPLQWAMTQMNLGDALTRLGERESGTARLEEAVAAYRGALLVLTHERVPLQWAMSTGNQGVAMKLLAGRSGDAEIAKLTVQQLKAASTTLRDDGDAPPAAYYEAQLNTPVVADRVTVLRRTQKAARHHRIVN